MTVPLLYFSDSKKELYYIGIPECFICHKQIEEIIFIKEGWTKYREHFFRVSCKHCVNIKDLDFKSRIFKVSSVRTACVLQSLRWLPKDAQPIFPIEPPLSSFSGETTFEASYRESESAINNTKYASRESVEGAKIGLPIEDMSNNAVIKDKLNQSIDEEQLMNILESHKNGVPLIEHKERLYLEKN